MNLPELHCQTLPNGDPYPVLLCLPNGTPIAAIADHSPDYPAEEIGEQIVNALRTASNVRLYTIRHNRRNNN